MDSCHLIVMTRPGYQAPDLAVDWQARLTAERTRLRSTRAGLLMFVTVPASEAASSRLRRDIGQHRNTGNLLHPAVSRYIEEQNLYRTPGGKPHQ